MNPINFDDPEWEKRFIEYLQSNNRALDAFRSWIDAGIPEDWLLHMLHGYANPALRRRQQLRYRTMALASLKEIDGVLKTVSKVSRGLANFAGNEGIPDWIRNHHYNLRRDLATLLAEYRIALGDIRKEVAKFASEKGEGVGEELLVGLVEATKAVTGQPNWGDLAYLVEAAYFAHNLRIFECDRDKMRKRYDRFVKNFPRIYEEWICLDWKSWFGLEQQMETPSNLSAEGAMERFMERFGRKASKPKSVRPRYGKIHTSMKR